MRRRRALSADEARLWAGVARSAIPLKGKAFPDAPAAPAAVEATPDLTGARALTVAAGAAGLAAQGSGERPEAGRPLSQHPIERPTLRKLGKGRLALEARIDLHEMTQDTAHHALAGFLRQAQAMGMRHVLVITGRGSGVFGSRGVLRRVVPHWFATPPFRSLVSGFEAAERHHGGEGALYVRVRRRP